MSNVYQDMAKSSVILVTTRFVLKFFSVISYFLILRQLSMKDYGFVTLALSISGPALAISGLGLDDILLARGARARGEKKYDEFAPVIGGFVFNRLIILIGITGLLFFIRSLLGEQYLEIVNRYMWQALAWIWAVNIRCIVDGIAQMFEKFKRYSLGNVLESALRAGMVTALFFASRLDVGSVLWVYIISKSVPILLVFPALRDIGGWGDVWKKYKIFWLFIKRNGAWETLRMLAGGILSGAGQWITAGMLGLEAVAILSFATSLNSILAQLSPFRQVIYPAISRLSAQAESATVVARRMAKYAIWLAGLMLLISLILMPVGVWLLAPKYFSALPVFFLLAIAQLMNGATISHGPLLYSFNEQKLLLGLSLVGTVSSITLLPLLVWFFGIFGVVLENHISTFFIAYFREMRLRKKYGITSIRIKDVFYFGPEDRKAVVNVWRMVVKKTTELLFL